MKTGFTHAEMMGCKRRAAMYEVMELLEWSEDRYCGYMYRMGLEYLKVEVPDEEQLHKINATNEYWGWWKLQWYIREREWLDLVAEEMNRHQPYVLVTPNGLKTMFVLLPEPIAPNIMRNRGIREQCYLALHDAKDLAMVREMEEGYARIAWQ